MGFRPEPTIYNLKFDGTALDGLHVRSSCCTVSEYNEMLAVAAGATEINSDVIRANERILELFSNHLVSWDLEDPIDGSPVPANRAGIDAQERTLVSQLITAWQVAMVTVPNLSKPDSSDGGISAEASLGLGNLSESPGS